MIIKSIFNLFLGICLLAQTSPALAGANRPTPNPMSRFGIPPEMVRPPEPVQPPPTAPVAINNFGRFLGNYQVPYMTQAFCNDIVNMLMRNDYRAENSDITPLLNHYSNTLAGRNSEQHRAAGAVALRRMARMFQRQNAVGNENSRQTLNYCYDEFSSTLSDLSYSVPTPETGVGDSDSGAETSLEERVQAMLNRCEAETNPALCQDAERTGAPVGKLDGDLQKIKTSLVKSGVSFPASKRSDGSGAPVGIRSEHDICNCALSSSHFNDQRGQQIIAQKREMGLKLIQDALNKKFLDSYAQNLEDMKFFAAKKGDLLNKIPKEEESLLSCNNPADFESEIATACAGSGVDLTERERRKSELFGLLGPAAPGVEPSDPWANLEDKVSNLPFSKRENLPQGMGGVFNRKVYDDIRHGFAENEPSVKQLNLILSRIINTASFQGSFLVSRNPMQNLSSFLTQKYQDKDAWLVFSRQLADGLPDSTINQFNHEGLEFFKRLVREATPYVPSLRIALSEKSVFNRLVSDARGPRGEEKVAEVVKALETEPKYLYDNYLKGNCQKIKKDFANAVCNDRASLFSRISNDQLSRIFASAPLVDFEILKAISCSEQKVPLDQRLDVLLPVPPSSLMARLDDNPSTVDQFELVMKGLESGNDQFRRYVKAVVIGHENTASAVSSQNLLSSLGVSSGAVSGGTGYLSSPLDYIDDNGKISNTKVGTNFTSLNAENGNGTTASSQQLKQSSGAVEGTRKPEHTVTGMELPREEGVKPQPETVFNYSNYLPQTGAPNQQRREPASEQARTQLREAISDNSNRETVDRFVSNVSDPQIEELRRLREQAQSDAEKLRRLTEDAQKSRIRSLEEDLRRLQEKRQEAIVATPSVAPTEEQRRLVPQDEFSVVKATPEQQRSLASLGGATPQIAGGQEVSVAGGGLTSPVTPRNRISGVEGVESAGLILVSNVAKQGAPDLSQEILRFLETEPDLQALTQLREKGMIFRYKVIKDGKESVEEVVIQFDKLSEEAKRVIMTKIERRRALNPSLIAIEEDIARTQRSHSYEALKLIIGQQLVRR